jgi:RNA polymerase sigma-70 factor (ECF subfamily)
MSCPCPDPDYTALLLEKIRRGDRRALDELLVLHRPYMIAYVERRIGRKRRARDDRSDVVQEAQRLISNKIDDYLARQPMLFHEWVLQTAHQQIIQMWRKNHAAMRDVDREFDDPSGPYIAGVIAKGIVNPVDIAANNEIRALVRQAINQLKEEYRDVLVLKMLYELPNARIALVLAISEEAARKRVGRALLTLRKKLQGLGWEG